MPSFSLVVYLIRKSSALLFLIFLLSSCQKDLAEPQTIDPLNNPIRPAHFPPACYNYENNAYSKKGFELGRKLFFDPILSVDNSISCGSCHHQKDAFADGGRKLSIGVFGQTADRNSLAIINMAWNTSFMWDGGINHLEVQPFSPIINPKEMGEDLNNVITKLRSHSEYPALFQNVFTETPLDDQQLFFALAQYMGNLVSANSRYDKYIKGEISFSQDEIIGLNVFRANCAGCHEEPLFTDYSFQNNGLDTLFLDKGRYRITQDSNDLGKFKTPTLRNIMLTAPYMHDGRFENIQDVINHYSAGIKYSNTLSSLLQNHVGGIQMSNSEKQALIDFLHTLTDYEFISNADLSE